MYVCIQPIQTRRGDATRGETIPSHGPTHSNSIDSEICREKKNMLCGSSFLFLGKIETVLFLPSPSLSASPPKHLLVCFSDESDA
jgi:hypothetical protein